MIVGIEGAGLTVGRIEFAPTQDDPLRGVLGVLQPSYTVEKPPLTFIPQFNIAPKFYWLIEVKFDGDERAPRYFTGECEPGWHGVTTINPGHAQKYSSRCLAQIDILKLAPRLIGEWVAREHGFS